MVASYSFSGNTLDGSALANHAQAENVRATTDRFGFGSSAYYFNGTNAGVTAANSSPLNSANTTISFWVKPNSFPGCGEAYILSNGGWQERWKTSLPSTGNRYSQHIPASAARIWTPAHRSRSTPGRTW
jgi:hypothetical protein